MGFEFDRGMLMGAAPPGEWRPREEVVAALAPWRVEVPRVLLPAAPLPPATPKDLPDYMLNALRAAQHGRSGKAPPRSRPRLGPTDLAAVRKLEEALSAARLSAHAWFWWSLPKISGRRRPTLRELANRVGFKDLVRDAARETDWLRRPRTVYTPAGDRLVRDLAEFELQLRMGRARASTPEGARRLAESLLPLAKVQQLELEAAGEARELRVRNDQAMARGFWIWGHRG
jgi:hypothetical protein